MAITSIAQAENLWLIELSLDQPAGPIDLVAYDITIDPEVLVELQLGDQIQVPLPDKIGIVNITTIRQTNGDKEIAGIFIDQPKSLFYLRVNNNLLQGRMYEENASVGYHFDYSANNILLEKKIDQIECIAYGLAAQEIVPPTNSSPALTMATNRIGAASSATVPIHQNLPGSSDVLYIDFDGETENGRRSITYNNGEPIVAAPFSLDADPNSFNEAEIDYIEQVWIGVSEDYALFNVNVTTDRAIYDAASEHHRAQIVVTPTCEWINNCGYWGLSPAPQYGVYENTSNPGAYDPGWAWPFRPNGAVLLPHLTADTVSHEFGHGFRLGHDGTSSTSNYTGNFEWAPIMGLPLNPTLITTWSKGEYPDANQFQDDIGTISGFVPYRFDDAESSSGEGIHNGIVGSFDSDSYSFFAKPTDTIDISATVLGNGHNNLDVKIQLYAPNGALLVNASPTTSHNASINHLPSQEGRYSVSVSGVSSTVPNSYTRYGSVGQYTLNIDRTKVNPDPFWALPAIFLLLMDDQ